MDRIPTEVASTLMRAAVTAADLPKAAMQRLQRALAEQKVAFGKVVSVRTEAKVRNIAVQSTFSGDAPQYVKGDVSLIFPPNLGVFENELMRAQSEGLRVLVGFTTDAAGEHTIQVISVFAGAEGRSDWTLSEREVENLRRQLARVDVQIKDLLEKIERKKLEESDAKDQVEEALEHGQRLLKNLQMATDAYAHLLQTISSMFAQ